MVPLRKVLAAILLLAPAPAGAGPVARWSREIAQASSRFAIPEEWIRRVIRAESGGRATVAGRPVVSRAGAMGLMQLMPATWRDMRRRLGLGVDPHDPADNIAAGSFYLRLMYDRFGYPGLFAAYNAGPARYAAYLAGRRGLPPETRLYVATLAGGASPLIPGPRGKAAIFAIARSSPRTMPASAAPASPLFVRLGAPARP